jgi:thioesterase domain-containing protein
VSPNARRAWGHRYTTPPFGAKVRAHLDTARGLPALERPRYVGRRVANLMYTTARRATGRLDGDTRKALAFDRALAQHHAGRFQGRALLVLHEGDTAVYTADPEQEWAKLADEVEVVTVPGSHHAMLEGSGALRVAELLDERAKRACAQA